LTLTLTPASLVDPAALMKIRSLELRAKVVVEGLMRGIHRSPFHGFSVEFTEYRAYTPGDDVRFLDWRLYARSDRDYVKKFEDETNLRAHFVVDHSRSMAYGSRGYPKSAYAATAAATLAFFLAAQGDAVGALTVSDGVDEHLPARNRPGQLRRLFLTLERAPEGRVTALGRSLDAVGGLLARRGLVVLLSDLLAPVEELARPLAALAAYGHEVVVVQILDPAERAFDFEGAAVFRDLESGRTLFVDGPAARGGYQRALEAHLERIRELCRRVGIEHHLVGTDEPLERALLELVAGRVARGRAGRRRAAGRSS
jgi:uncharacterized protein (DUF58 family)